MSGDAVRSVLSAPPAHARIERRPMTSIARQRTANASELLIEFIDRHPRLFVLTGAGCSTDSGIPDYRDADGEWKRGRPVMLQDFLQNERARKRYWARSVVGWRRIRGAHPN